MENDGKILLIERKQYNFGFALPAGHQDGDDAFACAKKELGEEVGLVAEEVVVKLQMRLQNPCKREGGAYHNWSIVEAIKWSGDVNIEQPDDEAKSYVWADKKAILKIAKRLEDFTRSLGLELSQENLPPIVKATNENPAWKVSPGLEPPMYFIFKEMKLI